MYHLRMPTEKSSASARPGAAYNPVTHFILAPIFTITFGVAIAVAAHAHAHRLLHWWLVVVSFAFILLTVQQRMYSLRVQDRVIRLEETLRLIRLAPGVD